MQELTANLEFKNVTVRPSTHTGGLSGAEFALRRGEIMTVMLEEGRESTPLASLAQGLITPDSGTVFFNGEDWAQMGLHRQAEARGRTRRVFDHYGWISNLDVLENLCLAECHSTTRSPDDVEQEVRALARRFGIDTIPDARPTRVHSLTLRKLEWVRAFVGAPELIILERPCFGAPRADVGKLIEAIGEAALRGVAVLWMAEDVSGWTSTAEAEIRRFQMLGERLVAV